jgi:hypothetical protein
MVDLVIAANFARELTDEQFAPSCAPRRAQQTHARTSGATRLDAQAKNSANTASPRGTSGTTSGRGRLAATPLGRVVSRLVQVRG